MPAARRFRRLRLPLAAVKRVNEGAPWPVLRAPELFEHAGFGYDVRCLTTALPALTQAGDACFGEYTIADYASRFLTESGEIRKRYRGWYVDQAYLLCLREQRLAVPGLAVDLGWRQLVIDGNHRLVARFLAGHDTMHLFMLTATAARRYRRNLK